MTKSGHVYWRTSVVHWWQMFFATCLDVIHDFNTSCRNINHIFQCFLMLGPEELVQRWSLSFKRILFLQLRYLHRRCGYFVWMKIEKNQSKVISMLLLCNNYYSSLILKKTKKNYFKVKPDIGLVLMCVVHFWHYWRYLSAE